MARIVELTDLSGAYASRLFVEAGHEVIRIEGQTEDSLRYREPLLGGPNNGENSAYHHFLNAGKKSLALNLDSSAGREIFLRLLAESDVLIANTPLALAIDDAALMAANAKLVYTKIEDEEADICAMARSGLMSLTGQPDRSPMVLGGDLAALATGVYVAVATAAALRSAKKSGECSDRYRVAARSARELCRTGDGRVHILRQHHRKARQQGRHHRDLRRAALSRRPLGDQPDPSTGTLEQIRRMGERSRARRPIHLSPKKRTKSNDVTSFSTGCFCGPANMPRTSWSRKPRNATSRLRRSRRHWT